MYCIVLGFTSRFCTVIGEVVEAIGDERGEVTGDEMGAEVEFWLKILLSAPENNIIAIRPTIIAPAMIAFFVELFLFRLLLGDVTSVLVIG